MTPPRRPRDRGSAAVEAALAVVGLLSVGYFTIGALRVTNSGGDADAAARAAARAAAAEYDYASAAAAASSVASSVLADRGVACGDLGVAVDGSLAAGSVVSVSVTCIVSLSDAALAGFAGSRTVTGHGAEFVDVVRGGG
jgi:Flp pilus assembly protein TadG